WMGESEACDVISARRPAICLMNSSAKEPSVRGSAGGSAGYSRDARGNGLPWINMVGTKYSAATAAAADIATRKARLRTMLAGLRHCGNAHSAKNAMRNSA